MNKQYQTMITPNYIPDWSVTNGVREALANALDSPCKFEYIIGSDFIELTSVGFKLPTSCLLLGKSENRSNADAVGTHGEGVLVMNVPLLREGKAVTYYNDDVIWTPAFEYSEQYGMEVLVINETNNPNPTGNYSIRIENLTSGELADIVSSCLYLQEDLGTVWEGTRGRMFDGVQGKLYVGGLFVTNISGCKYSYDFKPQYLPLNRDRKTPESYDIHRNTASLMAEVMKAESVAELVRDRAQDVNNIYYRDGVQKIKEECFFLFQEEYGDDAVVVQWNSDKKDLEDKGFTNVVLISDDNYRNMIEGSNAYKSNYKQIEEALDYEEDERSPVDILEAFREDAYKTYNVETTDMGLQLIIDLFNKRGVSFDDSRGHSKELLPF